MWRQRNPEIKTIEEFISKNMGIPYEELVSDKNEYKIYSLPPVVEKLKEAAKDKIFVTVVGDYDADGLSASAIMDRLLSRYKIPHKIRIPKRHIEGYGLKKNIIDEIDEGIVFTVDNGIVAFDAIDEAKKKGLFVIITDHHQKSFDGRVPNADIVVNPSAFPETADFSGYCGAGIVYKLAEAMLPKGDPLLKQLVTIAMIGTVADVMKLEKDNRKIVNEGLKNFISPGGCTQGLCSLRSEMGLRYGVTSTDIGFAIGPALNAPSRLEGTAIDISISNWKTGEIKESTVVADATMSLDILTKKFSSWDESNLLASQISQINNVRKKLKREQLEIVMDTIESDGLQYDAPIVVYHPSLHTGIIGILAGCIVEDFGVPAIVFANDPMNPDYIKGSARSPEEVDIKALLDRHKEDIVKYGAHARAGGLTLKRCDLEKFREDLVNDLLGESFYPEEKMYDFEIKEAEVEHWLKEVDKGQPYGEGCPEPVFLIRSFRLFPSNGTLFTYSGLEHVIFQGETVKAAAFFLREKFDAIKNPKYLDILFTIGRSYDKYGVMTPTLFIKDLQEAEVIPERKKSKLFKRLEAITNQEERLIC